jgi:hypothetical protein
MSQRTTTVYTCDLCSKTIPDARKAIQVVVRGTVPALDIGPCCADRTIADLSAMANKRRELERIPA